MLKIKQLNSDRDIEGKRILLRVDFNVPLNDGAITETSRIQKVLPVIRSFINKKAKIIIISHLGRPKGKIVPKLTLKPIAKKLSDYLNQNVVFLDKTVGKNVIEKSKEISNGKVLLLENLRFCNEEEANDKTFAVELAKNGDIYINEAFSCSHRAHASVSEITKHIESFAGKTLIEEVNFIKMLTSNAKKPVTCIIGGSKISSKIGVLSNLVKKRKNFLNELKRIKECSYLANDLGIEVHAGHGLDYKTTKILTSIKEIEEFNIGHFIIGESIFMGFKNVVKKFKTIIK